jgi:putative DNA primase/helicase
MNTQLENKETSAQIGIRRHWTHSGIVAPAEMEPWPDPIDGSALLDDFCALLRRFVVLPKWAGETLALWVLHTYAFHLRDVSTYIGLESPEKRCGKTTLLAVLSELVSRPVVAANISSPAFFRVIEEMRPTLLIDEADTFLQGNDELRGILNSGYTRKTAYVVRVSNQARPADDLDEGRAGAPPHAANPSGRAGAPSHAANPSGRASAPPHAANPSGRASAPSHAASRLARFSCWCPKVMAAIGRLPDTLADRCILIRMQRKTVDEECERLRNLDGNDLRRKCLRFILDNESAIASTRPEIPDSLNDRAADIWEPLLVLADLAGGNWPEQARDAAVAVAATAQENNPSGALLFDLLVVFARLKADRLFSRRIVAELNAMTERPWAEMNKGREVNELWLAQRLRHYGIHPKTIWIGDRAAKGYFSEDFQEVFSRYIPQSEVHAGLERFGINPADVMEEEQTAG